MYVCWRIAGAGLALALALVCGVSRPAWAEAGNGSAETFSGLLREADRIRTADLDQFQRLLEKLDNAAADATPAQREYLALLQGYGLLLSGQPDTATGRLRPLLEEAKDPTVRYRAGALLANTYAITRQFEDGLRALDRYLPLSAEVREREARHHGLLAAGILYNQVGEHALANSMARQVLSDQPVGRNGCIAGNLVIEAQLTAETVPDVSEVLAGIDACVNAGEPMLEGFTRSYLARVHHAQGRTAEAVRALEEFLTTVEDAGYPVLVGVYHSLLAEYRMQMGEPDAAEHHANEAVVHATSIARSMPLVAAYRTLSEIAERRGDIAEALRRHRQYADVSQAYLNDVRAREMAYRTVREQAVKQAQEIELLHQRNELLGLQQQVAAQRARNRGALAGLLVLLLASTVYWGLKTKRVQMRLQRMARFDMLTGIRNRHYFTEQAAALLARCAHDHLPAAMVMFDLDHFKQVNDRFGHAAGDWVLAQVAASCSSALRSVDCFGRMGGEEFAILLPGCDVRAAARISSDLRARLARIDCCQTGHRFTVSASFGVTDTAISGYDVTQLLSHADKAMYRSKRAGRNRVVTFDPNDARPSRLPLMTPVSAFGGDRSEVARHDPVRRAITH